MYVCMYAEECMYVSEASELSQQQEELQAQVGPEKRPPSKYQLFLTHNKRMGASIKSCSQEAVCVDKNHPTGIRQERDRVRQPRKAEAFENQLLIQSQFPSSLPSGESVPHPSPTCMHQVCQVLWATSGDPDESSVFSDLTLLLRQKMLLQHLQGEKCP